MSKGFKFVQLLLRGFLNTLYDVKVVGLENMPKEGGVLVCANHLSALDPILMGAFVDRHLHFMAKHELFKNYFLAKLIRSLGGFPVNRESVEITSLKHALGLLKDGKAMGIFAQGGREVAVVNEDDGKAGVAMFAVRGVVPVVPVGIVGSFRPFTRIMLNMGEPIYFEEHMGKKVKSAELSVLTKQIMVEVKKLAETDIV